MRIAAVFAHPADMATEAGGTLALHALQGDEVKVIILTHGGRLHPNVYIEAQRKNPDTQENTLAHAQRDQILEIKYREMQQSASILGVAEIVCLEVEDTMGTVNHALIERTAEYLSL
jgi:LmbE family N-acetylglucosaminyl deacetylase